MFKTKKCLYNITWIIICACVAAFFVIALCVYTKVEPSGVSELLSRDETWYSVNELCVMPGNLEMCPYVTKVYEYATDNDSVDICWINDNSVWREKIDYGIVADESSEYNYIVECYVYSDIADKQLIKRTWGVSVTEGDVLTLAESKAPYCIRSYQDFGDIKKDSYNEESNIMSCYYTFIRITVKPGFDSVGLEVKSKI